MKITFTLFAIILINTTGKTQIDQDSLINSNMYKANQYLTGSSVAQNIDTAFNLYLQCALLGKPQAMIMIGSMFFNGDGVEKNRDSAVMWITRGGDRGYKNGWYLIGNMYKNVPENDQNYDSAFYYFSKGEYINDTPSTYMKAYMLYKGFGCTQDYIEASSLFSILANNGDFNSMYFYGLCLENGYGVTSNTDSALYWLNKAFALGHIAAGEELQSMAGESSSNSFYENDISSDELAKTATFQKITQNFTSSNLAGNYKGTITTYDWSGNRILKASQLNLEITVNNRVISGIWLENDSIKMHVNATISKENITFHKTNYYGKDHDTFGKEFQFCLENATLRQVKKNDSTILLTGNVKIFSPKRNEPQCPIFISLVKTSEVYKKLVIANSKNDSVFFTNKTIAYPNPFSNTFNIAFDLAKGSCNR